MSQYSNQTNLPTAIAVWLAHDTYDRAEAGLSATSLLKPVRQVILSQRIPEGEGITDVSGLIKSRIGTAIHDAIERAWISDRLASTLKSLGASDKTVSRVKVNPETIEGPCYHIYLELRSSKDILGVKVTGKFDFIDNGKLIDFKTTSTFAYTSGNKDEDYIMQGSIYRWLNPDIITDEFMDICFIFTDWQKNRYMSDPRNYPSNQIISRSFKLHSAAFVQSYVEERVRTLIRLQDVPEKDLPLCTDKDLWRKPDTFKYYKNPQKQTKSTANFDNLSDANRRFLDDGAVGLVKTVKGGVSACLYCSAFTVCTQKDRLIESGELKI